MVLDSDGMIPIRWGYIDKNKTTVSAGISASSRSHMDGSFLPLWQCIFPCLVCSHWVISVVCDRVLRLGRVADMSQKISRMSIDQNETNRSPCHPLRGSLRRFNGNVVRDGSVPELEGTFFQHQLDDDKMHADSLSSKTDAFCHHLV